MRTRIPSGRIGNTMRRIIAVAVAALLVNGCVIPLHRAVVNETPAAVAKRVTQFFPTTLYRLAAGDVLEILYLTAPGTTPTPYTLQPKDSFDLEFAFHPELNRTVRVRPDGKISIPRKNDVSVVGQTADEVKQMLTKLYSDLLRDPEITVSVREFSAKMDELQKAMSAGSIGQPRLINILPDGQISLPLVPSMRAEGFTVSEISRRVNDAYKKLFPEMKIAIMLREILGNVVFVDGEVAKPGVYNSKTRLTVQQAIALAGGTKETAEPRTVLVVSKAPDGRFLARTTNLTKLTSESDYLLQPNDLVYVSMSTIARADVWVDQNIRKLLMFTGWSLGIAADLGRTTAR
ncbi:MAG: polysaccharide biosynthesis/export family protein [Desulfomonile tiedjei]|nr:polysaccharide biosynthesis/export family protein [Desulfomonile tiedjei]